ncbi:type III secretion protein hrcQa [Striga asiatica]|uniref:Type III secretion protein hrcQa n=1 Tax=Striga asiatica TaxID=4170 RepID=A0A5A7QDX3_STRAF|nr:type III secretion protein hrcQa [Striga asiatica]
MGNEKNKKEKSAKEKQKKKENEVSTTVEVLNLDSVGVELRSFRRSRLEKSNRTEDHPLSVASPLNRCSFGKYEQGAKVTSKGNMVSPPSSTSDRCVISLFKRLMYLGQTSRSEKRIFVPLHTSEH